MKYKGAHHASVCAVVGDVPEKGGDAPAPTVAAWSDQDAAGLVTTLAGVICAAMGKQIHKRLTLKIPQQTPS